MVTTVGTTLRRVFRDITRRLSDIQHTVNTGEDEENSPADVTACIVTYSSVVTYASAIQYSTKVFGALEPSSRFLAISPKQVQISTPNFQHPLSHQYHTLCKNLKVQGTIGRPQMTSE